MRYKRNNILKYIDFSFDEEKFPLQERVFILNNVPIKHKGYVIYLMTREFRFFDNFALRYAKKIAFENNLELKVLYKIPDLATLNKQEFYYENFEQLKNIFRINDISFLEFKSFDEFEVALLVVDFSPLEKNIYDKFLFRVVEIDGHNILPSRFISNKQEYSAMSFRIKVYKNIGYFLKKLPDKFDVELKSNTVLLDFIKNKLMHYSKFKNNPNYEMTSNLSAYINFGFISSYRIAIEILKSSSSDENKEAYLEELIVRKELAENFCLYCKDFKNLSCIPNWAKNSIQEHKNDFKKRIYSINEFENARTDDELWNACQRQLMRKGKIESYLRMYWAKMLLKWTYSVDDALKTAIYLNDKYAYDAPSANGYTAILWSLGGLHDRAFKDREIYGKIRPMTYNGAKSKFDVLAYIDKYKP